MILPTGRTEGLRPGSRRAPNRRREDRGPGRDERSPWGPGLTERIFRGFVGLAQFVLLTALLVSAGYQSHYIFFKALYFRIQEIAVKGNRALDTRDVIRLSGLDLGDLFFKYNYEKVKDRIRANRRVESVRVVVISPNSIEIRIREKRPRFLLADGGDILEVDQEGTLLGARVGAESLPLILGADLVPRHVPAPSRPEDDEAGEPEMVRAIGPDGRPEREITERQRKILARWIGALESGPFHEFQSIDIANPYEIVVTWKGVRLVVSSPEMFATHLALVQPILIRAGEEDREIESIDLRFPSPVLRFRQRSTELRGTGSVGLPGRDPGDGGMGAGRAPVESPPSPGAEDLLPVPAAPAPTPGRVPVEAAR